jgi:hypothetical protein
VYGLWWWPAYPPVYLRPWSGYYARPAAASVFYWSAPVGISPGFFFGAIDWRQRQVRVMQVHDRNYNKPTTLRQANVSPQLSVNRPGAWRHDPERRSGTVYRSVETQQRFGAASAPPDRGTRAADTRPDARFDTRQEVRASAAAGQAQGSRALWTDTRRESLPANSGVTRFRPEAHVTPQAARGETSARFELPRPLQPRMQVPPAQSATRQEFGSMTEARHEPALRHELPQASAPRAEIRLPLVAALQEPGTRVVARPRKGP